MGAPGAGSFQYGLVLEGFDDSKQKCLASDGDVPYDTIRSSVSIADALMQVVNTVGNPCITAGDTIGDRFVAACAIDMKYMLAEDYH